MDLDSDSDLDLILATTAIEQPPLSQPFPLSPRAPSSSLHKSLIVSEDGIVQLPDSGEGEEDISDNETSRQLEDFMASQKVAKVRSLMHAAFESNFLLLSAGCR